MFCIVLNGGDNDVDIDVYDTMKKKTKKKTISWRMDGLI